MKSLSDLAIGITIFAIVIALLFVPIGVKEFNGGSDIRDQGTITIPVDTISRIAHLTSINVTNINATASPNYGTVSLYYDSNLVANQVQNVSADYTYTTGAGDIGIELDSVADSANIPVELYYANDYGLSTTGKTIMDNVIILVFAVLMLILIWSVKQ